MHRETVYFIVFDWFYSFYNFGNEWKKCKAYNLTMFKTVSKMSTTTSLELFKILKRKKHVKQLTLH